jgi:UDP-N-acetylmuramoylalanine--D-glutamate ligase
MKVAIIGYGIEGRSALHYYEDQGAHITVCDQNESVELPAGVTGHLGEEYLKGLDSFDVVLRTASVKSEDILAYSPGARGKITTVVNEFLRVCPTEHTIGVTGTKGKGTTCTLILKMLEAAGEKVFLGGNFGTSPLDFLPELTRDSWVVLELSSFQLSDITHSPHIGVCLMVAPEHLDWHGSAQAYYEAKAQMFAHQQTDDVAIYYAGNVQSHHIASHSPGDKIAYYDEPGAYVFDDQIMIDQRVLCKTGDLKMLGKHNWQNVCAAVTAVWQAEQTPEAITKVLMSFTGLPNRLELVREKNRIRYYNDSFASDPYATEGAIEAIAGTKILIVGGYERMLPLEHFAETVAKEKKQLRHVLLIGASAERVAAALKAAGYEGFTISQARTMDQIVAEATKLAKSGDAVVLSPGFASFDMFKNFEVRGQEYRKSVNGL